jgi:hypothetical protein
MRKVCGEAIFNAPCFGIIDHGSNRGSCICLPQMFQQGPECWRITAANPTLPAPAL